MYRIINTKHLDKLMRDSAELDRIHRFAARQDAEIRDIANNGENARPPDGDDWNDLWCALGIHPGDEA